MVPSLHKYAGQDSPGVRTWRATTFGFVSARKDQAIKLILPVRRIEDPAVSGLPCGRSTFEADDIP